MTDLRTEEPSWDLRPLTGTDDPTTGVQQLLETAKARVEAIEQHRGRIATATAEELSGLFRDVAEVQSLLSRAGSRAHLEYVVDMAEPARGALLASFQEQATAIGTRLVFVDLEWAAVEDARAEALLADPALSFCKHYLRVQRASRPYLLSEAEEKLMAEKSVTGTAAWTRLFDEQLSDVRVHLDGEDVPLDSALARTQHADREVRRVAAEEITKALAPGLRTRAYIYNTLLADKSIDDRLRVFPTWVSSRNLANQASDASVAALVAAVTARNDIPQRWYRLKAKLMGLDQLMFWDRNASLDLAETEKMPWADAVRTVRDAYYSFSAELGAAGDEFFDNAWIDVPVRKAKSGGAFCAPVAPGYNPYLLLNYTGTRHDVLTLAHELGHGVHFLLSSRSQSIFEMSVPLTVAETASVFGETVTFGRLLAQETDPRRRLALLASNIDGQIATVFRQVSMWRFEDLCHAHRRREGELSVDTLNGYWMTTQQELFGGTVDTTGYDSWWSYITHFVHVPGYVYAYAFGNLLALSVYRRFEEAGPSFVPAYLELLKAGGSRSPEDLAAMVGCDLRDPEFWNAGLALVDETLRAAEEAAAIVGTLA